MKSFIFVLSCVVCLGQLKAQKDSSKFSVYDVWLTPSILINSPELVDFRSIQEVARNPEQIKEPANFENYFKNEDVRNINANASISLGFGFKVRSPKSKCIRNSVFRISANYVKMDLMTSVYSVDSSTYLGAIGFGGIPGAHGFSIVEQRQHYVSYYYTTSIVSLEASHLFTSDQDKWVSGYVGYSIAVGASVSSSISESHIYNRYLSEGEDDPTEVSYRDYLERNFDSRGYKAKGGILLCVGMPAGVQFRMSKKKKAGSRISLGLETTPKMAFYFIGQKIVSRPQISVPMTPFFRFRF